MERLSAKIKCPLRVERRERRVMLELFAGISLAFLLYSFFEEWHQRRLNKSRLNEMRKHFKVGRRWDVAKGQWSDN